MTVCVAALAAHRRSIVCVADKALSYGDYIQWDSDSSKIIKLNPSGATLLVAGDEQSTARVMMHIKEISSRIGSGSSVKDMLTLCEQQYTKAFHELLENKLLRPRLLNKTTYTKAVAHSSTNHIIRSLADEVSKFQINCDLLVCGFDTNREPFIFHLESPGVGVDMTTTGFHAIGSGAEKAVSRLLFAEHKREHDIERVLFDAFDAKANAEMAVGVGYAWDASIILGGKLGAEDVPIEIKELIKKVWSRHNQSPFDSKIHTKGLEKGWRERLQEFSESVILKKIRQSTSRK